MRLTFAAAQLALASHAPDDVDILKDRINRAHERIILDGKFTGSTARIAIAAIFGDITLPRHYRTIEGVKVDGRVTTLTNGWYEFLEGKSDSMGFDMNNVRSMGDGWAIMRDLPVGGTLVSTENLNLYREDAFAMPIAISLLANIAQANPFSTIARVNNPGASITSSPVTLTHVADDTITTTLLARIEPNETDTFYRRY